METTAGLIVIASSLLVSLAFPLTAPFIGTALTVGGLAAYRKGTDATIRRLSVSAIGAGLVILLICATVAVGLVAVRTASR